MSASITRHYGSAVRFKLATDLKALALPGAALLIRVDVSSSLTEGEIRLVVILRDAHHEWLIKDGISIGAYDTDGQIIEAYSTMWERIKAAILPHYADAQADLIHPFID